MLDGRECIQFVQSEIEKERLCSLDLPRVQKPVDNKSRVEKIFLQMFGVRWN